MASSHADERKPQVFTTATSAPAGSAACPATPWATMRAVPSPAGSTSIPSARGNPSTQASMHTSASARAGTAFLATPPVSSMIAPALSTARETSALTQPFSPQQTANSASGVNKNAGGS